jgi:alkylhydroperoxidase/carboxymuconolactone decarboxylase family protein YurZ
VAGAPSAYAHGRGHYFALYSITFSSVERRFDHSRPSSISASGCCSGRYGSAPGLSKRDRSLITCATLIALGREKLVGHLQRALDNGLKQSELSEVITHLAFYAGWPAAMTAALVAKQVLVRSA